MSPTPAAAQAAAVLPDYAGANLVGVVPGLMARPGQRPDWIPEAARDAEQVVLLVLDGLGWNQLQERLDRAPELAALSGHEITSVAPTTTACALTSLVVGAPPARHGIVGYRVAVETPTGHEVMNVLKWRTPSGDARPWVDPATFQSADPFGGRPVPVVSKADFAGTGFTVAHQRGSRQVGWYQVSGMTVETAALVAAGEPFVYAYYDGVDRIAHIHGFGPHYDAELLAADRIVGDLLDVLPPSAALVVTADHGQVQVGAAIVELDATVMEKVAMVSGEPRFRWLHTPTGSPEDVAELEVRCRELYGHQAWVATYAQVEADGWLGGPVSAEVRPRLGDVALVPFEAVAYVEPGDGVENRLMCRHGSLTAEEMFVPLIAGRGRLRA
ncbi:MAG TPA: alkaline phosphatase family protein [Acidimicrobiales bacterium]|nr:alkaline phosphatase family protein [Acidimicrobiales bacterium]